MIEVRIDTDSFNKITHDVTHSIRMVAALKQAGLPFKGILLAKGIERGTLNWWNEEGLDGTEWVIRWYDTHEDPSSTNWKKVGVGSGDCYTWASYVDPKRPAPAAEDEEL